MRTAAEKRTAAPGRRRFPGVLLPVLFLIVLDGFAVPITLVPIRASLHTSFAALEWVVIAYPLAFCALLPVAAALGTRSAASARRTFVVGQSSFALMCAACALAPTGGWLIAARAGQGVAAALVVPAVLARLGGLAASRSQCRNQGRNQSRNQGRTRGRIRAPRGFAVTVGLAACTGPLVGGVATQWLGWRWMFWIGLPIAVAALASLLLDRGADEGEGSRPRSAVDVGSSLMFGAGSLSLLWALVRGDRAGWDSLEVIGSLAVGAVLLAVFVSGEIPLGMFRLRAIATAEFAYACAVAVLYGSTFLVAQYLQVVMHGGPLKAAMRLSPLTAGLLIYVLASRLPANRLGLRRATAAGLLVAAAGLSQLAYFAWSASGYSLVFFALVVSGLGLGFALASARMFRVADGFRRADPAGEPISMLRTFASMLGVAVLGAVFASRGGYSSPARFTAGFTLAVTVAAGLAALGAFAALAGTGSAADRARDADTAIPSDLSGEDWPELRGEG